MDQVVPQIEAGIDQRPIDLQGCNRSRLTRTECARMLNYVCGSCSTADATYLSNLRRIYDQTNS